MDPIAPRPKHDESGFTLIEVLISAVILVTGLVSLAYAMGLALGTIDTAQMDSIARQKARQAMEDVFTARDTGSIPFSQICNQPGAGCTFLPATTWEPLYTPGYTTGSGSNANGLVFTSNDGYAAPAALLGVVNATNANSASALPPGCITAPCIESVDTPGPDGILGTADDVWVPLNGYLRNITITQNFNGVVNLNQIIVTIKYTSPNGISRSVTLVALIGPYV